MSAAVEAPRPAQGEADVDGVLLRVDDLVVDYLRGRHGVTNAVRGISFEVKRHEVVAIVGESGSGKSTVAQAVLGLLPPSARVGAGRVTLEGEDLLGLTEERLNRLRGLRMAFVPQDPTTSLNPLMRVGSQIAETLTIHRLRTPAQAESDAVDILASTGIGEAARRARQFPHQFSGGMRQRALIGIALACDPQLIIADEPTSALDVTVQKRVLDQLDVLISQHHSSVLLITHDLGVAADRADRIVVMQSGLIVEEGTPQQVLRAPQHEYTKSLVGAAPSLSTRSLVARETIVMSGTGETDAANAAAANEQGEVVLRATGLVKEFHHTEGGARGHFRAVDGVSLEVRKGRTLALVGESGSGKSTTARLIARLTEPTAGTIVLDGQDITRVTGSALRAVRKRVQVVYQSPWASLDPRFDVTQIIEEPMRAFGIPGRKARARELLELVALDGTMAKRKPRELSGGQRQRVAVARALALSPDLVVLDEPVSALDVSVQDRILRLLAELQSELGLSYLFITHDLAVVQQVSHDVAIMQAGRIVESGPSERILRHPQHPYTQGLLDAIPGRALISSD